MSTVIDLTCDSDDDDNIEVILKVVEKIPHPSAGERYSSLNKLETPSKLKPTLTTSHSSISAASLIKDCKSKKSPDKPKIQDIGNVETFSLKPDLSLYSAKGNPISSSLHTSEKRTSLLSPTASPISSSSSSNCEPTPIVKQTPNSTITQKSPKNDGLGSKDEVTLHDASLKQSNAADTKIAAETYKLEEGQKDSLYRLCLSTSQNPKSEKSVTENVPGFNASNAAAVSSETHISRKTHGNTDKLPSLTTAKVSSNTFAVRADTAIASCAKEISNIDLLTARSARLSVAEKTAAQIHIRVQPHAETDSCTPLKKRANVISSGKDGEGPSSSKRPDLGQQKDSRDSMPIHCNVKQQIEEDVDLRDLYVSGLDIEKVISEAGVDLGLSNNESKNIVAQFEQDYSEWRSLQNHLPTTTVLDRARLQESNDSLDSRLCELYGRNDIVIMFDGTYATRKFPRLPVQNYNSIIDESTDIQESSEVDNEEDDDDENDSICAICNEPGLLYLCDTCPNALHKDCIGDDPPGEDEDFICPFCLGDDFIDDTHDNVGNIQFIASCFKNVSNARRTLEDEVKKSNKSKTVDAANVETDISTANKSGFSEGDKDGINTRALKDLIMEHDESFERINREIEEKNGFLQSRSLITEERRIIQEFARTEEKLVEERRRKREQKAASKIAKEKSATLVENSITTENSPSPRKEVVISSDSDRDEVDLLNDVVCDEMETSDNA